MIIFIDSAARRVEEYNFIDFPNLFPKQTMEDLEKKEEKFGNKLVNNAKTKPKKEKEVNNNSEKAKENADDNDFLNVKPSIKVKNKSIPKNKPKKPESNNMKIDQLFNNINK